MSRVIWDEFVAAFAKEGGLEPPTETAAGEDGQDLPIFLYTREHLSEDGQTQEDAPDIAYIGLDEASGEIVTHVCLDAADPTSSLVLLQILEQNNYLFSPADPAFSLTPDGQAVTMSARHPLRAAHGVEWVAEWKVWLDGFLDMARLWNQDLERLTALSTTPARQNAGQGEAHILRA